MSPASHGTLSAAVPTPSGFVLQSCVYQSFRSGNGGTSTAAAVLSSYLALAMQKWPDATGNQIIQSLIRNTKSGKGKPVIDPERKRGFGEVDLNALLTVDPTQYKDVNPILEYQMKAAAPLPAIL